MYSHDEMYACVCTANGVNYIANRKGWLIRGGGRLLADLNAKSMMNDSSTPARTPAPRAGPLRGDVKDIDPLDALAARFPASRTSPRKRGPR